MGFLADLGIQLLDRADTDLRRVGQRLGFMPLSWRQAVMQDPSRDGLMWRIPDPTVPMASSLFNLQAILVTEYERAIVLRNGVLEGEEAILLPGIYDIRRVGALRGQIEVLWFTTREFQLLWGVGGILSKDGYSIGASGHYNVAIVDPEMFFRNVTGSSQVYTDQQLLEFARSRVSNAIRDQMALKTVMEFQQARPEFQQACKEVLMPEFQRWGLEFRGLTIEKQNLPEDFLQLAKGESNILLEKKAQIAGATADITLAQLEMQKAQYAALAEANRLRLIGTANAEVLQSQMAIGLDPLELQRIEAMKTLAEHPSEGALVDVRPQIMAQLQPPAPMLPPGAVIVTGAPLAAPVQQPLAPERLPTTVPSAQIGSAAPMTREKIEEMLDKLDERFSNGEISEQTYLNLQDKWQKRLEKL